MSAASPCPLSPSSPQATVSGMADSATIESASTQVSGNVVTNDTKANTTADITVSAVAIQGGATGAVGQPMTGALGTMTINADGRFTYAVNTADQDYISLGAGQTTTETFTYTPKAGDVAGSATTVTVTVTGVNDAPVAIADTGSAGENETKLFDVLANDTDPDAGDSKTLVSIDGVTVASANGTVNGVAAAGAFTIVDGQIQFAPGTQFDPLAEGESATVTVNYTMRDAAGVTSTSTLTVTVTGAADGGVVTGPSTVDLANLGARGATLLAPGADLNFGWSLAGGADVTGDGIADLVVGAPAIASPASNAGAIYIFSFSGATPTSQTIAGETNGDRFGYSVSIGDLNSNATGDILIGAPGMNTNAGAVYGLFGGTTIATPGNITAGTGFRILGIDGGQAFVAQPTPSTNLGQLSTGMNLGDNFGAFVEGGNVDFNADGRSDFFVARPGVDAVTPGTDVGISYILFGKTDYSGLTANNLTANGNGFGIATLPEPDAYGYTSVWSGDVNGGGMDLIIGDPRRDNTSSGADGGGVIIAFSPLGLNGGGTEFNSVNGTAMNGTNGVRFYTTETNAAFGASVTAADLNNDGYDDVIVGAPGAEGSGEGRIYILMGQSGGYSAANIDVTDPASITAAGATVITIDGTGSLGASVSYVGDFNNDGIDDIVVGAPDDGANGSAYVLLGGDSLDNSTYDLANPGGRVIKIVGAADNAGAQVQGIGDVNNDGYDDVAIASVNDTGRVDVVYGFELAQNATALSIAELVSDEPQTVDHLLPGSDVAGAEIQIAGAGLLVEPVALLDDPQVIQQIA